MLEIKRDGLPVDLARARGRAGNIEYMRRQGGDRIVTPMRDVRVRKAISHPQYEIRKDKPEG
jgi:hypothetical protein